MSTLSDYIKGLMREGYSEEYIRKYLQDYGYTEEQVNEALGDMNTPQVVRHEHHVSKSVFVFVVFMAVIVGTAAFFIASMLQPQGPLLDFAVEPNTGSVESGDEIGFTLEILNLGEGKFDVTVNYRVSQEETIINSREETFAVSTSLTRDKTIPGPVEPGIYRFEAIATYDGKVARSGFTFRVEDEVEPEAPPSTQNKECNELEGDEKDDCLTELVRETERPEFCNGISSLETRDNCYMNFIVKGQDHLCSKVKLEDNINYCNRISDVRMLNNLNSS